MEKFLLFLKETPSIWFYALSLIAVLIGDFHAKSWSVEHKNSFFIIAAVGYLFSGILYMPTLLKDGLVITATIWMILNIIGFLVIGFLIFKESITPFQMIGMLLGLIAIGFLSFPSHS